MKKILLIAVALISSSVMMPAMAQSKKEKKQKNKTEATCKHANGKHHDSEKHCNKQAGECCKKVVQLTTASDSLSYAAGMNMTDGLMPFLKQQFDVDTANINDVARGFRHAIKKIENKEYKAFVAGEQIAAMMAERMLPAKETEYKYAENQINPDVLYQGFIDALTNIDSAKIASDDAKAYEKTRRAEAKKATERAMKAEGEAFLAENAKQEGVVTLPSGLQYKVLREGNGAIPKNTDEVVVKYEGTLIDGTKFDSSYDRNPQTATFRPTQVIKGWTEALTMMPVGSKWMLFIPENLAYGERQAGKIPPYSTLIFTVELDAIK